MEDAVAESDEEEKEEEQLPVLQERKDPFYVKDPHKALKNFYQKEGVVLNPFTFCKSLSHASQLNAAYRFQIS